MKPVKVLRKSVWQLVALLGLLAFQPLAAEAGPQISSQYYCVVDRESGQTILAKNADVIRPMASTTKMMTAILAVEYADLNGTTVVSLNADRTPEYTIGLRAGQQMLLSEALKVAMIRSANDAAVVIAEHIAGDEQLFAYLMSKKAFAIGAMQTRFQNASGLPDQDHYSTALDLARIGSYALSKPFVAEMAGTVQTDFQHPGYQQPLTISNTNGLLKSYPGADGIKTGTTNDAGKCLVASANRGDRGLIAVVLKSGNRQGDCIKLLDYGFLNTAQQKVVDQEESFKSLKVNNSNEMAEVVPAEDLWLWAGENPVNIERIVRLDYNLHAPLQAGQPVGEMDIYFEGDYVDTIALINQKEIKSLSWWERLQNQ